MKEFFFLKKNRFFLVPEELDAELEDSDEMRMLAADFEIGHMLRDSIVPKAVLYYTGEAGDEEDGDDENRYDEDEEEEEPEEEELDSPRLSNLASKLIPYHVMEFLCRKSTRTTAILHNISPETIE